MSGTDNNMLNGRQGRPALPSLLLLQTCMFKHGEEAVRELLLDSLTL